MLCVRGPRESTGRIAGAGVDGEPEPNHLFVAAQSGAQFVEAARVGAEGCEMRVRVQCLRVHGLRARERLVIVACRKPCDPLGSEIGSNPSASAVSTMAICCEGVFTRYKGVLRRALKVVRQAGPRKVWICSTCPCLPSPTSAWICSSVIPK
jgi:hypothetical protein